jgi:hypothetical protein
LARCPPSPEGGASFVYGNIIRHDAGDLTAEVVNDAGKIRRFRITQADDGSIDVDEL